MSQNSKVFGVISNANTAIKHTITRSTREKTKDKP